MFITGRERHRGNVIDTRIDDDYCCDCVDYVGHDPDDPFNSYINVKANADADTEVDTGVDTDSNTKMLVLLLMLVQTLMMMLMWVL